jgi:hypothetical protein
MNSATQEVKCLPWRKKWYEQSPECNDQAEDWTMLC